MKLKNKHLIFLAFILQNPIYTIARSYEMPPTVTTLGNVPIISDEQMKICVETYNKTEWLKDDLSRRYVNQYDSYAVEQYNQDVKEVNQLANWFNLNCAGKQSYSACKAANELNRKNHLPEKSCR